MFIQDLWNAILELTAKFVIPDWGSVIAMIPVILITFIAIILIWVFRKLRAAPPARRGKQRIPPKTPPSVHMPGPSLAPIFASVGAFLTFLGLIYGGWILVLGLIGLGLTLLYWLSEALRVYDKDIGTTTTTLPAVVHDGPPPGVHLPGPSFRPILGAVGATMVMVGLIYGGWLLITGVLTLIITLGGWLIDARKEWVKVQEADVTGHLENIPAPRTPSLLLAAVVVLFVGGLLLQTGILPPAPAAGVEGSIAPGEPGAEGLPDVTLPPVPEGSGAPASGGPPQADVVITAKALAFEPTSFTAPADTPFTMAFVNDDPGLPHNVALRDSGGADVYVGEIFNGVATEVYDVPALPAGEYTFLCSVHPNMTGTASLQ